MVEGILAGGMAQVWAVQPRACVVWENTVFRAGIVQAFAWRRWQLCLG